MAKRKRRDRLYWRERGGEARAYGDFRDFTDVGGGLEALRASGEKLATTDQDTAQVLISERLRELEARRRGRVLHGITKQPGLFAFAREHLIAKARAGQTTDRWLAAAELYLRRAIEYFGAERDLASVTVTDVRGWVTHLQAQPSRGHVGTSGGTVRHHLNALSNLYRRAQGEGYVLPGYNPVAALMEKPSADRREARWLEVPDAALLLESARTVALRRADLAVPFLYPLVATFLLTGGRRAEVLGLEVSDVSFDRKTVTFRVHDHRRLKTATSARVVPLWPQLEEILRPYVFGLDCPPTRLLFPSAQGDGESMVTNFDGALDQVAIRAGFWEYVLDREGKQVLDKAGKPRKRGTVRSKMFRHTYCSARLQTLDHGAPVSTYSVGRELGHGGDALVRRIYGHLGEIRHRSGVVEYRVEQHEERLRERLTFSEV